MNHYETLDVPTTAGQDDIKQAYRKVASAEHPDRGGDAEKMKDANRAYDVLSDPASRERYDAGKPEDGLTLAARAEQELAVFFSRFIDEPGNIVELVRSDVHESFMQMIKHNRQAEARIKKLQARRDKVRVKTGANLLHQMIDTLIAGERQTVALLKDTHAVALLVQGLLDAYKSDEEETPWADSPFYGNKDEVDRWEHWRPTSQPDADKINRQMSDLLNQVDGRVFGKFPPGA